MATKYPLFDRSRLAIEPLGARVHDLQSSHWLQADEAPLPFESPE
jgi:hypothetical protein